MRGYAPLPVTHQGRTREVRSYDLTRYEIVAEHDGETFLICYTARPTVSVLLSEMQGESARILDGSADAALSKSGKGRQTQFSASGWTFRYSGRTEREAVQNGERRQLGAPSNG